MTQPPNDPNQWRQYGHQQPPQWAPPAAPPTIPAPKKRRKWPWIVGGVVLLFVLISVANSPGKGQSTPNATTRIPYTPPQVISAVPAATPGTAAPAPAAPAPAQSGAQTTFGSGTYEVGTDIQPGKYKTTGPENGPSCYWARLKNTSGDFDSIIANGNAEGPTTVTISKSDAAFETNGCTWTKAG